MTYDPNRPEGQPIYTETVETTIVRDKSNTALWWIAGLLGLVAIILLAWLLVGRDSEDLAAQDQLTEAQIQAELERARLAGELSAAQQGADFARADAMRASAEAQRATMDARMAEARAESQPPTVIIERPGVTQAPPVEVDEPVVTPPVQ